MVTCTPKSIQRLAVGPCNLEHLCRDLIEQCPVIVACNIDIEVGSARQEGEMRLSAMPVERRLKAVRRSIQMEGVVCADNEMNLAPQAGADGVPVGVQVFDDVVMTAPIGSHVRIDVPCDAVE